MKRLFMAALLAFPISLFAFEFADHWPNLGLRSFLASPSFVLLTSFAHKGIERVIGFFPSLQFFVISALIINFVYYAFIIYALMSIFGRRGRKLGRVAAV